MLLTRLVRLGRTDERGSVLVAVIGVMVVGLILTSLIMTSVVTAYGQSTATRAGVQSHAAADAGIVAARTALFTPGNCLSQPVPGTYTSTVPPVFSVRVDYNAGLGWQSGCPPLTATQVRLVSTGAAQAKGVDGASSGDKSIVESVFQYLVPGPHPSGVGMYFYGGAEVDANSTLDLSEAGKAGLITKQGDLVCSKNNTVFNASLLVNGNLDFGGNNSCSVTGNAWVSGSALLGTKGHISGNLIAPTVTPNPPGTAVGGTYSTSGSVPTAPNWVNVTYQPTDWKSSLGLPYEVRTSLGGLDCTLNNGYLGGTLPGAPVILNMLACPNGPTTTQNTTVKLTSDVVIFANKFNFNGINSLTFVSSSTAARRLWFITPDNGLAGDKTPTCDRTSPVPAQQGNFVTNNSFAITAPVAAMLYTPCAFDGTNGFTWNGQIYAGEMSYAKNNPHFTFTPVGVAGVNFDTGDENEADISKAQPGAVISMRDVSGG